MRQKTKKITKEPEVEEKIVIDDTGRRTKVTVKRFTMLPSNIHSIL